MKKRPEVETKRPQPCCMVGDNAPMLIESSISITELRYQIEEDAKSLLWGVLLILTILAINAYSWLRLIVIGLAIGLWPWEFISMIKKDLGQR